MAIPSYLDQYQNLMQNYISGTGTSDFQSALEKAIGEKTQYNQDLINQQNQLQSQMYNLPAQARAEYLNSNITNPLAQEALIAQQRQGIQSQLGSVVDLLNARKQNYSNILSQAMGREQQAQEQVRLSAENAWRLYQDQLARQEAARQAGANASALQLQRDYLNSLMNQGQGTGGAVGTGETFTVEDGASANTAQAQGLNRLSGTVARSVSELKGAGGRILGGLGELGTFGTQLASQTPLGQTRLAQNYYDWLNRSVFNPMRSTGYNMESTALDPLGGASWTYLLTGQDQPQLVPMKYLGGGSAGGVR